MDSPLCLSSKQDEIQKDFLLSDVNKENYLHHIRGDVVKHSGSRIKLKKVENYSFTVGSLEGTSYRDDPDIVEEWEQFYLPDHMYMEVIGVLEKFPCESCNELVLMVCEDRKVYGYAVNRLHLVANSLKELFEHGLQFPGTEQYYHGQSFENMTDEELDEVMESGEVKGAMMKHRQMLEGMKDSFLTNLDIIMGRSSGESCQIGSAPTDTVVLNKQHQLSTSGLHSKKIRLEEDDYSSFSFHQGKEDDLIEQKTMNIQSLKPGRF